MEQKSGTGNVAAPHLAASDIGNRRHQIFPTLSEDQFDVLLRYGERRHFAAGEVLFRQGERGSLVYVVESGEVELLRERADGSEERLAVAKKGDYFGELAPLLGFPRAATARARKATTLRAFDVAEFRQLVGSDGIAQRLGKTPAQVALAWGIQRGTALLTTSKTPTRIKENYDISALPEDAMREISEGIEERVRFNAVVTTGVPGFIPRGK